MTVDYIEYRTTHQNGDTTYTESTQAILGAPETAVKVEQLTHYTNGNITITNRNYLIRKANT